MEDFPIRGTGTAEITYDYVIFDYEPTTQEVFNEIVGRGARIPDRAEAETFFERNPKKRKQAPFVALCGFLARRDSRRDVASVDAHADGVRLYWRWTNDCWGRYCRFLVVKKNNATHPMTDQITKTVTPDRSKTPQEMLDATGRTQYVDKDVVAAMPKGEGKIVEVVLFKIGKNVTDAELEEEYEKRGLIPASPYDLAALDDNEHSIGTHWKDDNGRWCYATFRRWSSGRGVRVARDVIGWFGHWWFGARKKEPVRSNGNGEGRKPLDTQTLGSSKHLVAWSTKMQKQLERVNKELEALKVLADKRPQ